MIPRVTKGVVEDSSALWDDFARGQGDQGPLSAALFGFRALSKSASEAAASLEYSSGGRNRRSQRSESAHAPRQLLRGFRKRDHWVPQPELTFGCNVH